MGLCSCQKENESLNLQFIQPEVKVLNDALDLNQDNFV